MSSPDALLASCRCGRRHALIPTADIRAGRTWACSPKCLADFERQGVKRRKPNTNTTTSDKGKP